VQQEWVSTITGIRPMIWLLAPYFTIDASGTVRVIDVID
jgi:hypothetical protein